MCVQHPATTQPSSGTTSPTVSHLTPSRVVWGEYERMGDRDKPACLRAAPGLGVHTLGTQGHSTIRHQEQNKQKHKEYKQPITRENKSSGTINHF